MRTKKNDCSASAAGGNTGFHNTGRREGRYDFVVALAGNPNTGKSTVFNSITGLHQHTGNWPGKTVTRAEGQYCHQSNRFRLIDLPGTYSLLSNSTDEEIARNFLLFEEPDVTIVVVDATRLERNLNLVLQIFEITSRVVICLNLMDEARRYGIRIDVRELEQILGVPVVPTVARRKQGIAELMQIVEKVATGERQCQPYRMERPSDVIEQAVSELETKLQSRYPSLPNIRWVALRLLEGDERIANAIQSGELEGLTFNSIDVAVGRNWRPRLHD